MKVDKRTVQPSTNSAILVAKPIISQQYASLKTCKPSSKDNAPSRVRLSDVYTISTKTPLQKMTMSL